jgi:hypothetical protein
LTLYDSGGKTINTTYPNDDFRGGVQQYTSANGLPAGNYRVVVNPSWSRGDIKDYTVAIYAETQVQILSNKG